MTAVDQKSEQNSSESRPSVLNGQGFLPTHWAELTIKDLLGNLLTQLAQSERNEFLRSHPQDKSNGFYQRQLCIGSLPIDLNVPRVRSSEFRPALLPDKHQRGYADEHQALLLNLLMSARSKCAAKDALKRLKLPYSEAQMDQVISQALEEFTLKNTQPLDTDWIALWIDAKIIEVKDGNRLKPYTLYLAIGLDLNGKKRILSCLVEEGRETLEGWKKLLKNLLDRGLRRILITIQDDFSGLSKLTQSLFTQSKIQLCTVHLLRNVPHHLSKDDARNMIDRLKALFKAYDHESALVQFVDLCNQFKDKYPSFIETILKKKDLYLAFFDFPRKLRPGFSTTNTVEGINRIFEKIRLNNSGYFQSMDDLKLKLGLSIQSLEANRWKKPSGDTSVLLNDLLRLFHLRFESENS